ARGRRPVPCVRRPGGARRARPRGRRRRGRRAPRAQRGWQDDHRAPPERRAPARPRVQPGARPGPGHQRRPAAPEDRGADRERRPRRPVERPPEPGRRRSDQGHPGERGGAADHRVPRALRHGPPGGRGPAGGLDRRAQAGRAGGGAPARARGPVPRRAHVGARPDGHQGRDRPHRRPHPHTGQHRRALHAPPPRGGAAGVADGGARSRQVAGLRPTGRAGCRTVARAGGRPRPGRPRHPAGARRRARLPRGARGGGGGERRQGPGGGPGGRPRRGGGARGRRRRRVRRHTSPGNARGRLLRPPGRAVAGSAGWHRM
ncbi:MAG: hypothetical protein AVDCRST_MAG20-862, partial [uncultured Acidimicrobiales bacterium]